MFTVTCAVRPSDTLSVSVLGLKGRSLGFDVKQGSNTACCALDRPRVAALYAELGAWLGVDAASAPPVETRWHGHITEGA